MPVSRTQHAGSAAAWSTPWPGVFGTTLHTDRCFGRHWHATHGIGLLLDGAQHSASGRGAVTAYAGDLITTNPGEVHDGRPLDGQPRRWRMLYLEPGVLARLAGAAQQEVELVRPVIQDRGLRQGLLRLFHRLDQGDDPLACEEALAAVCDQLAKRHATARLVVPPGADLRRVRERLADELAQPPSLGELAAMVGLSRFQLLRRFTQAYGVPPHAWLQQQRVERARTLIAAGSSLADAAAACGFADQSHLTRQFSRHFGFSPGAWRRAACGR